MEQVKSQMERSKTRQMLSNDVFSQNLLLFHRFKVNLLQMEKNLTLLKNSLKL